MVALILAFVFRAFIVEAFVIPTGSMAPTLYGAHGTISCSDCGWEFAYGLKDLADDRATQPVLAGSSATCPNCAHANTNLEINDQARNAESGDRILVLKWPFDLGLESLKPARWDVTVFKNPADGVQNYIKRLVGLPGEVLMIVDGDIYTVPTSELSEEAVAVLEARRVEKYQLRVGARRDRLSRVPEHVLEELDEKLKIARKGSVAKKALRFVVYDHDYPPRDLDHNQPRWRAKRGEASGWNPTRRRVRFEPTSSDDPDYIELSGKAIEASYAYNIEPSRMGLRQPAVADQRVRFVWTPLSDSARIQVRLDKLERTFWATIDARGSATITGSVEVPGDSSKALLSTTMPPFALGKAIELEFENIDFRVALCIGGKEVLATSDDPADHAYYAPPIAVLRRITGSSTTPPRLYGQNGAFDLSHLVVERDIYYYQAPKAVSWCDQGGWGTSGNPILLRDDEYFMLGDNSPASQDSRLWGDISKNEHLILRGEDFQLGTVPADQLIGKAFFVYWPMAHRIKWLPTRWGVVPDVGRMRWIR